MRISLPALLVALAAPAALLAAGCKNDEPGTDAGADAGTGTDAAGPGPDAAVALETTDFPDSDFSAIPVHMNVGTGPTEVRGTIASAADLDLIAVDGDFGEPGVVDVEPAAGSSLDPDVEAYNPFGLIINYNGTGPTPPGAHLENVVPAPGFFVLLVGAQGGATSGPYVVTLSAGTYSPATTAPLADDGTVSASGTKSVPGSTLYFEVPVSLNPKCITVTATPTGAITPYVYVMDTGFDVDVASDDSGAAPFPPVLFAHPVAGMDGTLRLAVQDYNGTASASHTFDLDVASSTSAACP